MKLLLGLSLVLFLSVGCSSASKKEASEENKAEKEMAKEEKAKDIRITECKSNSDIRKIEITESEGDSEYEVMYTKFGETKSIATGSRAHTEKIRDRVKKNLENAGFSCS